MPSITKEEAIETTNSLISTLKEQIKDLQEHPEEIFFGTVEGNIKGWNDAIKKHQRDLKHLKSLPTGSIVANY